jgi:N-acetylated-alpha-linked acidic dipeptidase
MKHKPLIFLLCALSLSGQLRGAPNTVDLLGFDPAAAGQQKELETRFDGLLRRENLREWMKRLTAHPHHLGSAADKANADFIASLLTSWGYETQIETFQVLFPTPKSRLLEMTAPTRFTASLREPPVEQDPTSELVEEQLPTYCAYSNDGDVVGQLVYVNFGTPTDYEVLRQNGVDVTGKIVIARYGGSWRGIKPRVAAEHGAVGCIMYSDPREDGFFKGDTYPQGAWRNQNGVQRGSVCDLPLYPGDPLTPGVGATEQARRLPRSAAANLAKIPVLPVSYSDATPLLRALTGPVAPENWRGAMPLTYHLGPGPATVHLKLSFDWKQTPVYDVIARLRGAEEPDQWIIRGNHQDAWVCGADDPVSGTVALLEEARAVGELARGQWKPRRTIIYTIWDGEEPGLLGSTEWAETHADELRSKAAVYVNSDSNERGFLNIGGSHSLERFANQVARDVQDPETKQSVADRLRGYRILLADLVDRKELRERHDLRIGALGAGSDFTPFLQHLGIASLNVGYSGEGEGGSYHSIYDSFDHYTRFCDPDFAYGITLAQTCGRLVLRLSDSTLLPLEFSSFADTVSKYVGEVRQLADDLRSNTVETNRLILDGFFRTSADPTHPFVEPKPQPEVPFINFAPLQNACASLQLSARAFEEARSQANERDNAPAPDTITRLNHTLAGLEQLLTVSDGLPRRPWYQHLIYAPGFYTGYAVKTLPGVREAIEQRNWTEAGEQIQRTAGAIEKYAAELKRAAERFKSPRDIR